VTDDIVGRINFSPETKGKEKSNPFFDLGVSMSKLHNENIKLRKALEAIILTGDKVSMRKTAQQALEEDKNG